MISNAVSITSAIFAFLSLIFSYYIFKASRVDTSYLEVDKQYSDLLKLAMDDPDLRDYEKTSMFYKLDSDNVFKKKYHIYAFMCWNLVETIYDKQKDKKGQFKLAETWIPIMFEENRMHYTWFKHNIRLFKPGFQKFVTGELNDIEIIEGTTDDLKDIYNRMMSRDFATEEIKDIAHIEMLMLKKKYKLILAKHKVFNDIIGYAFIYEMYDLRILWLDYMAIETNFQNAGYGTLLFNKILEFKKNEVIGVFFEVEIPGKEGIEKEDQLRRIKFYERMGSKRLGFDYQFPTINGGFPMYLYFKQLSSIPVLPKEQIKEVVSSAYEFIHSDVPQKDAILNSFLCHVQDEHI
jgi:GNAT superfamily N-acetyltransferase